MPACEMIAWAEGALLFYFFVRWLFGKLPRW